VSFWFYYVERKSAMNELEDEWTTISSEPQHTNTTTNNVNTNTAAADLPPRVKQLREKTPPKRDQQMLLSS
jgi:hypothetical protein